MTNPAWGFLAAMVLGAISFVWWLIRVGILARLKTLENICEGLVSTKNSYNEKLVNYVTKTDALHERLRLVIENFNSRFELATKDRNDATEKVLEKLSRLREDLAQYKAESKKDNARN